MYTQCPECQIAVRVTVAVLQKAGGRVKCGGCGKAFNTIDHLSDSFPDTASNQPETLAESPVTDNRKDDDAEKNKALLKTLDELAGPQDVRIEDTGTEWRVLDKNAAKEYADEPNGEDQTLEQESDGTQPALELLRDSCETDDTPASLSPQQDSQRSAVAGERRYDDNTPLLDNFEDKEDLQSTPPSTASQHRASDQDIDKTDFDTNQVDMALADDDDWADLLDDYQDLVSSADDDNGPQIEPPEPHLTAPDDLDVQFNSQAEAMSLDISRSDEPDSPIDDESTNLAVTDVDPVGIEAEEYAATEMRDQEEVTAGIGATADAAAYIDEYLVDEEELSTADGDEYLDAGNELSPVEEAEDIEFQLASTFSNQEPQGIPDEPDVPSQTEADLLSQTMIRAGIDPSRLDTENIETIVMEGESVRGSLESDLNAAEEYTVSDLEKQQSLIDTYMMNKGKLRGGRRKSDPVGFGVIAGVIILVLVLIGQYIHASRQILATYGAFNQTLGPVYRALGKPVTPQWNIKGWQFENAHGSTDENEEVLTVFSHIRNTSDRPLPYPLVHVALTDRWEEVIGSKVLEPGEYLTGDLDPGQAVAPGDTFTAVIAIEAPSPEATGFQLYACYRIRPGRMRCATEDFKN